MNKWLGVLIVCMTILSAINLLYITGIVGAIAAIIVGIVSFIIAVNNETESFK